MLYTLLLSAHNFTRWLVLAAAIWALVRMWHGFATGRGWTGKDRTAGFVFLRLFELQFLLGIVLFVTSPVVRPIFSNLRLMVSEPLQRYFSLEHPIQMILALVAAQVGFAVAKRVEGDRRKFLRAAIGFTIAILLILAAIPWAGENARPLLRLPW
jgi:hypothetical protein